MPKLTLSMIVKNEEKYLEECLLSVSNIADEIVIVDTGSTDSTKDIARKFNAAIYDFEWIDDFSAARNFALAKSNGDWILYLDADERLSSSSHNEIRNIIKHDQNIGVFCNVVSRDKHNKKPSVIRYSRLFKNSENIKFEGSIHEQIVFSLKKNNYKLIESKIIIDHLGYDVPQEQMKAKAERNLKLLLADYNREKTDYVIFQIAQTYGVLNQYDNAIKYFDEIIERKESPALFKSHAWRFKAAIEFHYKRNNNAYNYAMNAEQEDDTDPVLMSLLSKIFLRRGEYIKACNYTITAIENNRSSTSKEFKLNIEESKIFLVGLEAAIAANDKHHIEKFTKELLVVAAKGNGDNNIEVLLKFVGDKRIGKHQLDKIVLPEYKSVLQRLIDSLPDNNHKLDYLLVMLQKFPDDNDVAFSLGSTYMNMENYPEAANYFEVCIKGNYDQPSTYFYLISIYYSLNDDKKLRRIFEIAEKRYVTSPEIMNKLMLIKQKLSL